MSLLTRALALIMVGICLAGLASPVYAQEGDYRRPHYSESLNLDTAPRFSGAANSKSPVVAASYDSSASQNGGVAYSARAGDRSLPSEGDSLPLSPPGRSSLSISPPGVRAPFGGGKSTLKTILTIGSSLAIVLGLLFTFVWFVRRSSPAGLPKEVFELLGRVSLAGLQQIHLVRCGKKLLLISATSTAVETLTEITDPVEVDRLVGICRQSSTGSIGGSFRQVFQQLGREQLGSYTFVDGRDVAAPTLRGSVGSTLEGSDV